MKQVDITKALRINACQKIGNHEYQLLKERVDEKLALYECKHCKDWLVTTPKTDEELHQIAMRTNIQLVKETNPK